MNVEKTMLSVSISIQAPMDKVWLYWTDPEHIREWNHASDDWHTPRVINDLCAGGEFLFRMEAKDGSIGFDFVGEYTKVLRHEAIEYRMGDGRTASLRFSSQDNSSKIVENFEAETLNPPELQEAGWLAILHNFKQYVENN